MNTPVVVAGKFGKQPIPGLVDALKEMLVLAESGEMTDMLAIHYTRGEYRSVWSAQNLIAEVYLATLLHRSAIDRTRP